MKPFLGATKNVRILAGILPMLVSGACGSSSDNGGAPVPVGTSGISATGSGGTSNGTGGTNGGPGAGSGGAVSGSGGAAAQATGGSSQASGGTAPSTGGVSGQPGGTGSGGQSGAGTGAGTGTSVGGTAAGNAGGSAPPPPPAGPAPALDPAALMKCTGTSPIRCSFGGPTGNYDVTVLLGGAAAGTTIAQAEQGRVMLPSVMTAAGETKMFSFTVNVRQPEGEPVEMRPSNGTPGLDVYFSGAAPQLKGIGYAPAAKPFMIYIAGDSTTCDQPAGLGGWGQSLPQFFDYPVSVANYADSGESSGSFLGNAKLFGAIKAALKPGDWVFAVFGHNDKTTSEKAFHDNMTAYVTQTRALGGFPLLLSPISRAQFNGNTLGPQHINSAGVNLPMVVKQVATETGAPFIDLTALTTTWLNGVGPSAVQTYFNGQVTHTNVAGANAIAAIVHDALRQLGIPALTAYMR
jgi:lysophospholipase L1-like esterase